MSHRTDCPTDWEARRKGERDFERGLGSWRNPYKSDWPDEGCPEASAQWDRGYRDAERREEERREEEARYQRMLQERAKQEAIEQYEIERAYYESLEQPEEQP